MTIDVGTNSIGTGSVVAVGSVIKTLKGKWESFTAKSVGACGAQTLISYSVPGALSADFTDVYDTNLQGIGIRILVWTQGQGTYGIGGGYYGMPTTPKALSYQLPVQDFSKGGAFGTGYNQIRVEIVRTASELQGGALQVTGPLMVMSD